jgi:thiamine transporter ThiT
MLIQARPEITILQIIAPLIVAIIFIGLCSLFKEPNRRNFSALMIAGAGAAYLNGGLLGWEFAFCTVMTSVAYWGLKDYRFIGIGWLLHTAWDTVHHLYGTPIVPFVPLSSFGCAICDPVLAVWYFFGAPSLYVWASRLSKAK